MHPRGSTVSVLECSAIEGESPVQDHFQGVRHFQSRLRRYSRPKVTLSSKFKYRPKPIAYSSVNER